MKVTFISRYGSKNIGDELIVRELEKLILKHVEDIDRYNFNLVNFTSLDEGFNHKQSNSEFIGTKSFSRRIYEKYIRKTPIVAIIRDLLNKKRARESKNLENYRLKLKSSDLLIIGGGNAFFDTEKYSSSYYYIELIIKEAINLKIPIYILNIGVGPFITRGQLENTIRTLKDVDYITVRDEISYNLLKPINNKNKKVFRTVDPVLFLKGKKNDFANSPKYIGVNVMDIRLANYSYEQYKDYINTLASVISYLSNLGTEYKITIFCTEKKDIIALQQLQRNPALNSQNKNISFIQKTNLNDILDVYKRLDLLIGTRMHSTILAFSQGIPFVGISWQQKMDGFFDLIDYNQNLIQLDDFVNNYKITTEKVNNIVNNYKIECEDILKKKEELTEDYKINETLLKKVIKKASMI